MERVRVSENLSYNFPNFGKFKKLGFLVYSVLPGKKEE